jgi:hypothetical protein
MIYPYKTTGKIIVLYILTLLNMKPLRNLVCDLNFHPSTNQINLKSFNYFPSTPKILLKIEGNSPYMWEGNIVQPCSGNTKI